MDRMPANTVETTLGALQAERLGRVNAHDHVIIDGGLTVVKEPDFRLDSVEKAIEEIGRWREAGGGAIVDTMPFGCGRDVEKLVAVSRATGIPIIVPTGFQKSSYYLPDHWQHRYEEGTIADLLIAECAEGVDVENYDGPIVRRSHIKAGIIKVAGDYQVVKQTTRKLIRAVGRAHRATGVPVLVHTEAGTAAELLLDLLEDAGVPPRRVVLSHVDRNPDFVLHQRLAQRGAFLQYDTPGRVKYQPENVVIGLMRRLLEAGYGGNLLLGGDLARRSYWKAYGGGPGYDYLLASFTERLRREGFVEEELTTIWQVNPVRWMLPSYSSDTVTRAPVPENDLS
jgi:predicted metal-dependent phosphotriesterase family hydrolase